MNLVDRERELEYLEELLIDCQHSRARVAVISGDAGIGKTALLQAFAEGAVNSGALWLSSTASPAEQSMPLSVLDQVFRCRGLSSELAGHAIELLERAMIECAHEGPACFELNATLSPVLHGLWKHLRELATHQPVIISIDDVHFADGYSMKFLLYLLSRLRSAPLLVILTERSCPPQHESVLPADLPEQPYAHAIRLKTLSRDGIEKLLAETLGAQVARALAEPVEQIGAGCPTLIQALIEDNRQHNTPTTTLPAIGEAFGQAVARCIERSGPLIKKLARTIAILDESVSPALLGKMLDVDTAFAAHALSAFTAKGTVDDHGFRQAAVRAAIIASIPPHERMAMHQKAAELLHNEGTEPSVVARHVVASGSACERWMITALQDAAEDALNSDQVDLAITYLQKAQEICASMVCDVADRGALTSLLARAEWRRDPSAVLRHFPMLESAARDGKLEGRHATMLLIQLLWHGRTDAAVDVLNGMVQTYYGTMTFEQGTPSAADTSLLWLLSLYPDVLMRMAFNDDSSPKHPFAPLAVTSQLQEGAALSKALSAHNDKDVLDIAEKILQSANLNDRSLPPLASALIALTCIDRLDLATRSCDALINEAQRRDVPTWHALFAALRSIMSVRRGNLNAALKDAGKALDMLPHKSWGVAVGIPIASMLTASVFVGDHAQADSLLRIPVPEQMLSTPVGLFYLQARGHYHLTTQRTRAALSDFHMCGQMMRRWNMDSPTLIPWRTDAALAYLQLGDKETAKQFAEEQFRLSPESHHRARGLALRILASVSSPRARPRLLQDAQTALQLSDDQLEVARVLADSSQSQHALNNSGLARKLARRAHQLAERCGATPLARVILPDAPVKDGSMDPLRSTSEQLSEAERRVASLAAGGHTNIEIAKKLYVTVSTVEQHLTRTYRKLDVDRSELPSVVPLEPTHVSA